MKEARAGTTAEAIAYCLALCSLLGYLPRNVTADYGLKSPPSIINEETGPQTYPQDN